MKKILLTILAVAATLQLVAQNKPIIGISCNASGSAADISYVEAVEMAGGIPLIIPRIEEVTDLEKAVSRIDGLLVIGGEDIDPAIYGEEAIPEMGEIVAWRDGYDIAVVSKAYQAGIPILGICRGIQAINVAFGGTLYQDLPAQFEGLKEVHRQKEPSSQGTHRIVLEKGTELAYILPGKEVMVNSFHHQAVKDVAPGFIVSARSPEGVIEAIEYIDGTHNIMGVQFHPEKMVVKSDTLLPIFTRFINASRCQAEAE